MKVSSRSKVYPNDRNKYNKLNADPITSLPLPEVHPPAVLAMALALAPPSIDEIIDKQDEMIDKALETARYDDYDGYEPLTPLILEEGESPAIVTVCHSNCDQTKEPNNV